jgi:hypothetical protein
MVNNRPNAPVSGAVNGAIEWADTPASSARAASDWKRRASRSAGSSPRRPNLASAPGWAGTDRNGASTWSAMARDRPTSGPSIRR